MASPEQDGANKANTRAILQALRATPAHGYEVMRRLEEMSGGLWHPSPGSIYPHLQLLEDDGVVESVEHDGTRTFTLTDKGAAEAARDTELPWESNRYGGDEIRSLRLAVTQLMSAAKQLSGVGDTAQIQRGIAVIQQARKEIYRILATQASPGRHLWTRSRSGTHPTPSSLLGEALLRADEWCLIRQRGALSPRVRLRSHLLGQRYLRSAYGYP